MESELSFKAEVEFQEIQSRIMENIPGKGICKGVETEKPKECLRDSIH